jgi:serine/threonine protein kinase
METVLAGRYYLIRPLGGGGFGQTFLATDRHLPGQPTCVVKQFKPRATTSESLHIAKRLFDLEAETLYRLGNHDRIPRLLAHLEQRGEFYLVQEFIEGESLQQELQRQPRFSEFETVSLLRDLLQVLAFVHRQQVIHRDIKPSNVIRRQSDRRLVLIDFGAVKQVSIQTDPISPFAPDLRQLTVAVGSPGYMPAEQLSSYPHFSSDVYAVGMLALQGLTGIHPIELPRNQQTGEINCAALGDRLRIHPDLAVLIDNMVRYDYRQRYANAAAALEALEQISLTGNHEDESEESEEFNLTATLLAPPAVQTLTVADAETLPPLPLSNLRQPPPSIDRPDDAFKAGSIAAIPLSSQEYRNRQALLSKVKNYWVKGVLETSLHDQVLIVLGLEARPDAIASPWNLTLSTENQPPQALPSGTQIISIFDHMGPGRTLLILGEPGSGKTTSLLQLTRDLVGRAEQDVSHLIPVVLNLSSWSNRKPRLADWVVEELNSKYQVPKKIGQPWVEHQQLLLLLDGLDEVQPDYRDACVLAINAFQQEYGTELVICSRLRDYEALSQRVTVQGAIYLRALTPPQIYAYLDRLDGLAGLKALLQRDAALRELAQSPLMLNILVLAYQDVAIEDLDHHAILDDRRKQLFNIYIDRMLRRGQPWTYSRTQSIRWLSWLARQMTQHSQTVFLIEQLQPTWLARSKRFAYRISLVIIGCLLGVPVGVSSGSLTNGLLEGWHSGVLKSSVNSLIFGLVFALVFGLSKPEIITVETLKWSWKEAKRNLRKGLLGGLLWGVVGGLLFGGLGILIPGLFPDLPRNPFLLAVSGGLTAGLTGGLVAGLISGLRGSMIETKTIPNQGMWRSVFSAGISGLIGAGTAFATVGFTYSLLIGMDYGLLYGIGYGLMGGLIAGFIFGGGQACLKHLLLRLILYRQGHTPWNYSRFLDRCCHRIFLQKVGGGYIFIHRSLMEHFAQMDG